MTETGLFTIFDALTNAGVECVIIGGQAVNHHGFQRATEDLDLVFSRTTDSELAVFEVLKSFDAVWLSDEVDPETRLEIARPVSLPWVRSTHLMLVETNVGYVDLFDFIPGVPEVAISQLFAESVVNEGRRFASLEMLVQMKRASGRPQDLADIEALGF